MCIPGVNSPRRLWRFNSLLLSDDKFIKFISDQISLFLEINMTPDVAIASVWEALKAYLRGQIISYAANKKCDFIRKQNDLEKQISDLDNRNSQNPSPNLYKERLKLRMEHDLITSHSIEYLLLKNRTDSYEHGEKTGEHLARQLKAARAKQTINGIMLQDGTIVTDQQGINDAFQQYYNDLYTSDNVNISEPLPEFFRGLQIPTLSSDDAATLDAPILQREIALAIKSLRPYKSPGLDGIPSEFYATFADELTPVLAKLFTDSFNKGILPSSLNQACITLLQKKDKNPLECGSYRPISFLNSD